MKNGVSSVVSCSIYKVKPSSALPIKRSSVYLFKFLVDINLPTIEQNLININCFLRKVNPTPRV